MTAYWLNAEEVVEYLRKSDELTTAQARIAELEKALNGERENVAHLKKMLKRASEYIRRFSKHEMYYAAWSNGVEPADIVGGKK